MTAVKKSHQKSNSRSKRELGISRRAKSTGKHKKRTPFARPNDGPPTGSGGNNG